MFLRCTKKSLNVIVVLLILMTGMIGCGGGESGDSSTTEESDSTVVDEDTDTDEDASDDEDTSEDEDTSGDEETSDDKDVVESWNIDTGYNSLDIDDAYTFETIVIDLDSQSVNSNASNLIVTSEDDGSYTVTRDGEAVATVSDDDYGIVIDATATSDPLLEFALFGGFSQTVTVYSVDDFKLSLNSVTINSSDGPAINIQSKRRAFVELTSGSINTLSDTATWSDRLLPEGEEMDLKGTVFSEGALIIEGSGSLDVTANKKHAIASDAHVRILEGVVTLSAYQKDGVRTNDAFIMDGGNLGISTSEGKGIKVEGKEDDEAPIGFIAINDGTIDITSHDKGIMAAWESDEDGDTDTLDDDPDPRVTINGGSIRVVTTGTPYEDMNTSDGDDSLSPEGIEAKSDLLINAGEILVNATDDGLNAGSSIEINGGYIYSLSSNCDAIDSNGLLTVNGGVIVAHGAGVPEGGMDNDQYTFSITGGLFVALGGSNSTPTTSATTQNTVSIGAISAGLLTIKDSSENIAIAFDMPEAASSVLVGGPDFITGVSYAIYQGGSIGSYSEIFNGLYLDPASLSDGTEVESFTISSTVTQLGGGGQVGPPGMGGF